MEFSLRKWTINDLDDLVNFANNAKIARNLTDQFPYPYTKADGERFINSVALSADNFVFAIDIEGRACGGIGLHPQKGISRLNAELGYWLAEPYWGKGIMTKAVVQITEWGFKNLEINRIFARPYGSNKASHRVLVKSGYKLEAHLKETLIKNNQMEDEYIYAIRQPKTKHGKNS